MASRDLPKQRRSLRNTLRDILWRGRRRRAGPAPSRIGSGILRAEPSLAHITQPTRLSMIPEEDERFDLEEIWVSIPDRFDVSSVATAVSRGISLKPQMSLSSFDIHLSTQQQLPFSNEQATRQWVSSYLATSQMSSIPEGFRPGASCCGSISTAPSLRSTVSTLRIRKSDQNLMDSIESTHIISRGPRGLTRTKSSAAGLRDSSRPQPPLPGPLPVPLPVPLPIPVSTSRWSDKPSKTRTKGPSVRFACQPSPLKESPELDVPDGLTAVKHFSSFCVLDTSVLGCPVKATSKELRYIFDIGEQFCLNNQGIEGTSMDVVTGEDAAGNAITHLVLFSPLVIPSSGRSRFMLASLIDVTDFLQGTASSDLSTISEESFDDEIPTPPPVLSSLARYPDPFVSPTLRYELSADSLLSGCSVAEPKPANIDVEDDVWTILATEEKKRTGRLKSSGARTPTSNASSVLTIDDVLNDFMRSLQDVYSDFFLLAKSPLDDNYYEICNVSPTVFASKDYVHGHLSRTSPRDMADLSSRLIHDTAFTMLVRWGGQGILKQLYCIPLFARISVTWVCFLVNPSLPPLWLDDGSG